MLKLFCLAVCLMLKGNMFHESSFLTSFPRDLISSGVTLSFSKMLMKDLTAGRNCFLSESVIRLTSESGKEPAKRFLLVKESLLELVDFYLAWEEVY